MMWKRAEFIAKLRKQLVPITDAEQWLHKLVSVKGILEQRAGHLLVVAIIEQGRCEGP